MPVPKQRKASVIIAAYDEEHTILPVIRIAETHPLVSEVIVVSDGSTDRTAAMARQSTAQVVELPGNCGKGDALSVGVAMAKEEVLVFLDADILGFDHNLLTRLIKPVLFGQCEMSILIRGRQAEASRQIARMMPLGGERALTRRLWSKVPPSYRRGFRIELALNFYAKQNGLRVRPIEAEQLTQVIKERKHGLARGLMERFGMLWSCTWTWVGLQASRPVEWHAAVR